MLLPKKVGSFTLMRTLGADGLTESFVGILDDPAGKQMVAHRVLPHVSRDSQRLGELKVRVRDLQACRHPTLVPLLDFVEVDGEHYILEDWVDTITLRSLINHHIGRGTSLRHNVYLNLATQVCNGLEALHGRPGSESGAANVLHMGLTPDAVHIGRDGQVMIGSYGLVRSPTALPHTGTNSIGTAMEYLAPEQTHQDQALSPASDIFALGTVLYELLTLRPMFRAESPLQTIHRIRRAEVTTQLLEVKEILPGLDRVLYRALSLNPRHRYQRAFVLREDLRGLMAGYTFSDIEAVTRDELAPIFRARHDRETDEMVPRFSTAELPGETTAALLGGVEPSVFETEHDTESDRGLVARELEEMVGEDSLSPVFDTDPTGESILSEDPDTMAPLREQTHWVAKGEVPDDVTMDAIDDDDVDVEPVPPAGLAGAETQERPAVTPVPLGAQDPAPPAGERDPWAGADTAELLQREPDPEPIPEPAPPLVEFDPPQTDTVEAPRPAAQETFLEEPASRPLSGPTLLPPESVQGRPPSTPQPAYSRPSGVPSRQPADARNDDDLELQQGPNWALMGGAAAVLVFAVLSLTCLGIGGIGLLSNTTDASVTELQPPAPDRDEPSIGAASRHDDPPVAADPEPAVRPTPTPREAPEPRSSAAAVTPSPRSAVAAAPRPDPAPVRPDPAPVRPDPAPVRPAPAPEPRSPAPDPLAFVDDIEPPAPPPPRETFEAVAMVESGPDPAAQPLGPLSGDELAAASEAAFAGSLDSDTAQRLSEVGGDDPDFTRARTLLMMDAKGRGATGERDAHLAALMSIPANRYNPALLVEEASAAIGREDWGKAIDRASLAERHWARLPSDLIFTQKAMMFEIQALAHTGLFYDSEGDDVDALNQAIRGWEKYRRHVDSKSRQDLLARADQHLDGLYEIQRRLE